MGNTVARQMIDRLSSSVDTGSGLGPLLEDPKVVMLTPMLTTPMPQRY